MRKVRPPPFWETINYPEFKREWNKVAGVHWDDGNQVEQIKHKVNVETPRDDGGMGGPGFGVCPGAEST